jgi:Cu2+-containing amine oxidase
MNSIKKSFIEGGTRTGKTLQFLKDKKILERRKGCPKITDNQLEELQEIMEANHNWKKMCKDLGINYMSLMSIRHGIKKTLTPSTRRILKKIGLKDL